MKGSRTPRKQKQKVPTQRPVSRQDVDLQWLLLNEKFKEFAQSLNRYNLVTVALLKQKEPKEE